MSEEQCNQCKLMVENYKYAILCHDCLNSDGDMEMDEIWNKIIECFKLEPIKEALLKGIFRTMYNDENLDTLSELDYETWIVMIIDYKKLIDQVKLAKNESKVMEKSIVMKINGVNRRPRGDSE